MKNLFNKIWNKRLIIGLWLILIAVFAVGGIYTNKMVDLRLPDATEDAQRYYDEVTLLDLEYNFDPESFGTSPYIATFTYEGNTYKTYIDITFNYVETIEGEELNLIIMSAVKHHAETEALLQNVAQLISYDSSTKTLIMQAQGFAGLIQAEIVLNASEDGIQSYTITSEENYDNEYNTDYAGASVPSVENIMFNQYVSSGDFEIDTVAGASEGTGTAMQELVTLLDLFINTLEGGN